MKNLTKKEFADILGSDGTKTNSKWQTEERKAKSLCNYEKNGRN
ncbi:hypothetical protein QE429_000850 [Bacillus sp. SORGH_AS 510]|nr:hypothetical protein [Bacillus sp. SORGH_AS_0510]MDQ1144023.1 hypothetical protein [Bacillus sp. SORGH_AS_0510]